MNARELAEALGQGKAVKNSDGSWNTLCPSHNDSSPSMTVTDGKGGTVLVRCHAGCEQQDVIDALIDRGLWQAKTKTWTPITPCPDNAPRPQNVKHGKFGKPTKGWAYKRRDGKLIGYIYRFESDGRKEVLPYTYCQADDGDRSWRWKSFDKPRPLFGEHLLDEYPDKPILVVEGEKTAEAAADLLGDTYLVISWAGGSKAVKFSNWEVLKGRKVYIWPDADEPGLQCAASLSEILLVAGIEAHVATLPKGLPKGWDLADPVPEGMQLDPRIILSNAPKFEPSGDKVVDEFNREFALVLLGDKAVILHEELDPVKNVKQVRHLSLSGFTQYFGNNFVSLGRREVAAPKYWLDHPKRRSYKGVVFEPGKNTPDYYNLWQGFSVEPDPTGDWSLLEQHIRQNIGFGDETRAAWLMAWFAQIIQQPGIKPGTSVSIRGKMGTGKTVIGQHMGALIHNHYVLVDDPRYVLGNFNSHMASALILHSDEAFWAGDPRHVGKLRGMVTAKTHRIEPKGKDSFEVTNYMRLLVTTNNAWVIPAGFEERRFAVFDIADTKMQDKSFFQEMERQLLNGGYGGLLHHLMSLDISTTDVGVIPSTEALSEQKELSLDTVGKFWFERLMDGEPVPGRSANGWVGWVPAEDFYLGYIERCKQWGQQRRETQATFIREIKRLLPEEKLERDRRTVKAIDHMGYETNTRTWGYKLPSLEACRDTFDLAMNIKHEWDKPDYAPDDDGPGEIPF